MDAIDIRPRVADLDYHLYDRPLHPELFEVLAARSVAKRDYVLTVRITRTGHAISWDSPLGHLTEVAAATGATLPTHRAVFRHKIRGERNESLNWRPGLKYQTSYQVETLADEVYAHVHDEILRDGLNRGLLHNFRPNHRLAMSPLGFVTTEAWAGNVVVSSFHTFPEERTVVKTQSLIEHCG
jgi:Protein of unknown function DUF2617